MKMLKTIAILLAVLLVASVASADTFRLGGKRVTFNPTTTVTKTSAYTITSSDSQVKVTCSSANIVITLPTVASVTTKGTKTYKILKTDATAFAVVVTPATGDTIGGESTRYILNQNDYVVISTGPNNDWTVDFESPYTAEDYEAGTVTTRNQLGTVATVTKAATSTLTAADCGKTVFVATDAIVTTLPATIAGCTFTFVNTGAAGNNILTINPNDADQIFGTVTLAASVVAIVGAAGDAVANTKATSIRGDAMTLVGDGVDGWYIASSTGIWADIN